MCLKSVTNVYGMIYKCKLRNHTGSRDVLVFQWDLNTVQSALKALQVSERFFFVVLDIWTDRKFFKRENDQICEAELKKNVSVN